MAREQTVRVNTAVLQNLPSRQVEIARMLGITKQRWHNYKAGKKDIPVSMLNHICKTLKLKKADLIVSQ